MTIYSAPLIDRSILCISGPDRSTFLQGLITNDVARCDKGEPIFTAMLTPQGKLFADFFILPEAGHFLIDTHHSYAAELMKKLRMYKLRADVEIEDISADRVVAASWGDAAATYESILSFNDPRHDALGMRHYGRAEAMKSLLAAGEPASYHAHRISLVVAEGAYDATDRSFILDMGYEELNAVDYQKGCYVGQEVTARMHYRGVKRKGMVCIGAHSPEASLPELGTPLIAHGDKETTIGEMRSSEGPIGLAMVKLEALGDAQAANLDITAGETHIKIKT